MTLCCLGVITSFFLDTESTTLYSVNVQNATANWTEVVNGTFTGLTANSWQGIQELWTANLYPNFSQDCDDPNEPVSFFKVFAVLFSGVTGDGQDSVLMI